MKGYMYILECCDGSYYVGSTKYLLDRVRAHQNGVGANYTSRHLPVKLVYFEEYPRIDIAYYREQQVKKWRRAKKEALIYGRHETLPALAMSYTLKYMLEELRKMDETGTLEDFLRRL